jgi:glycosyltransferase involved in cell wall biosynthesis
VTPRHTDLSLIIPAYNESAYIGATLEHVKRAVACADNARIEIIVVDNASSDDTVAMAAPYTSNVISESDHNVGRARNAGASAATNDVLVFLDADTLVPENFFARIAQVMDDSRCIGGSVDIDHGVGRKWVRAYLALWRWLGRLAGMAQGAAQFCRRDAFAAVGGYDERLFMGEDVDFYWRLSKLAKRRGNYVRLISDLQVRPSPRRFDQWPAWRILLWTNPLFILLFQRRRSAWRGWYEKPVR